MLVGAFNQEKALVGDFSVIVKPIVKPMGPWMEHYTALVTTCILVSLAAVRTPSVAAEVIAAGNL